MKFKIVQLPLSVGVYVFWHSIHREIYLFLDMRME